MKKERQKIELDKEKKDFKVLILINRKFFFLYSNNSLSDSCPYFVTYPYFLTYPYQVGHSWSIIAEVLKTFWINKQNVK